MKLKTEKRVDELMKKLQEKDEECQLLKQENKIKYDEVGNLTKKFELSDSRNKELEAKITEYTQKATSTTKEVADLNKTVSNLRSELGDAMHMKMIFYRIYLPKKPSLLKNAINLTMI